LIVVALRERDGIADIAQPALLRAAKLHTARDFSIVDIEAGDDALGEHYSGLRERDQSLACAPRVSNCMSEIPPPSLPKKEAIAPLRESIADALRAAGEFADEPPGAEPNYGEARLWLVA